MTNILNTPIKICSLNPVTGYTRDGYCKNINGDSGTHVVCTQVNDEFLQFTKKQGNDLITPTSNFPGLKSGDKWCLCALRWEQARNAGVAPPVDVYATDKSALKFNGIKTYLKHKLARTSDTRNMGGKRTMNRKTIQRYATRSSLCRRRSIANKTGVSLRR